MPPNRRDLNCRYYCSIIYCKLKPFKIPFDEFCGTESEDASSKYCQS